MSIVHSYTFKNKPHYTMHKSKFMYYFFFFFFF